MALTNGKYKGSKLTFTIGGIQWNADAIRAEVVTEAIDDPTFAELSPTGQNGTKYNLEVEYYDDYASGSFWSYLFDNAGLENVAVLVKPYGNTTGSTTQNHFTATIKVLPAQPGFGGTAGEQWKREVVFELTAKPTKVTS